MAAGRIIFPGFMPAEDGNGDRIAGAKAYLYDDGTTDLATTVYTDQGLTTVHANPVVADSLGVWPAMWADTTDLFTVLLTDGDGVPLSSGAWSGLSAAIDATLASVALAESAADDAEASAASALGAPGTRATSSTSLAIGLGAKTFVLDQTDKAYSKGQRIVAASDADASNQMSGIITDFDDDPELVVDIDRIGDGASGTHTDWVISLTGDGAVSSVAGLSGAIEGDALKVSLDLDVVQNLAVAGRQSFFISAGDFVPRTTNGPASGLVETTTNKVMLRTWDFDASTKEYVQRARRMPKSWDEGTITAVFIWKHGATVTNFKVAWALQAMALSDDDAGDTAFGTAVQANDTGGTTNDIYTSPETAAITIAGAPAAEDWVVFQAYRVADDAVNDTLTIDAGLLGVMIYYTSVAVLDS